MATKSSKIKDFEQSLNDLESIVNNMESGDLALDESLAQFEKGIKLANSCQTALQNAEQKVEILMQENGLKKTVPFDSE